MGPHAPSAPAPFLAAEQPWQSPVQAVLQHTESTQLPLAHSVPFVHAPPFPIFPEHWPPEQKPLAQSASTVQVVLQAVAPHTNGAQGVVAPVVQVPAPLQAAAKVCEPDAHDGAPQAVPPAYLRQAPAPLQAPSLPHVAAPWSAQSLSGSVAATTLPQIPFLPSPLRTREHAWQGPAQAESQHTPSTQKPLPHWLATVQSAPPVSFGEQVPALHQWPLAQSLSPLQLVLHAEAPQM